MTMRRGLRQNDDAYRAASETTALWGRMGQAKEKPLRAMGRVRIRLPVAAKTALTMAGRTGGRAGSPRPVGPFSERCQKMSMAGTGGSGGAGAGVVGLLDAAAGEGDLLHHLAHASRMEPST